ncbi:MAG: hypothetical protein ABSG95_08750 [Solirubrobacteraceae bacterium]
MRSVPLAIASPAWGEDTHFSLVLVSRRTQASPARALEGGA